MIVRVLAFALLSTLAITMLSLSLMAPLLLLADHRNLPPGHLLGFGAQLLAAFLAGCFLAWCAWRLARRIWLGDPPEPD